MGKRNEIDLPINGKDLDIIVLPRHSVYLYGTIYSMTDTNM